jgi:hypothetical protein
MIDDSVEEVFKTRAPRSIGFQHERKKLITSLLRDVGVVADFLLLDGFRSLKRVLGLIDGK